MPRLLLVEDEPDAALIVQRLGRRLGLEVLHRADVASAWECVRETPPDLVLLDLNLTGERGEELCRRIRLASETACLPLALFVQLGCTEDVVSGLEAGADYLVSKDLLARPEEWQARVSEILGDRNDLLLQPSPEALADLNRALRHPRLRSLGSDVLRFILRRAAEASGVQQWLGSDGLSLDIRHGAATAVIAFVVAVTEQLQRLLGSEAVREALSGAASARRSSPTG